MSTPRLLLVSPAFHGYWRPISAALSRRGYDVATHLYDARSAAGKVREKLTRELPARVGLAPPASPDLTIAASEQVRLVKPDVLLVVKGDILGGGFWESAALVKRRAVWLYDELRRTAHTPESLAAAGPIASYSPHDTAELRRRGLVAVCVPLAHDRDAVVHAPLLQPEVVFVGARYPKREAILTTMYAAGIPVRAYGRDWSRHAFDRARTWRVRTPKLPAGRDLPRDDAYAVMAGAPVSLNIHGDQDGFTMRTFEIPGVGGLELVDRRDVDVHYEPGREVLVFDTPDEAIELARRGLKDEGWSRSIREAGRARTMAEHTFDHRVAELERLWA